MNINYQEIAQQLKLYWKDYLYKFIRIYFTINKFIIIFYAIRFSLLFAAEKVFSRVDYVLNVTNHPLINIPNFVATLFYPAYMSFTDNFVLPDFANFNFIIRSPLWYAIEFVSCLFALYIGYRIVENLLHFNEVIKAGKLFSYDALETYNKFVRNIIILFGYKVVVEYLAFLGFCLMNYSADFVTKYGSSPLEVGYIINSLPVFSLILFGIHLIFRKFYKDKVNALIFRDQTIESTVNVDNAQPVTSALNQTVIMNEPVMDPKSQGRVPFQY
jgi:hypothetical protein